MTWHPIADVMTTGLLDQSALPIPAMRLDQPILSDQPNLFVSVLGAVRVVRDGNEVDLGPKLARLLAGLVAECGSVVGTSRLVHLVWGDDAPAGAERSIKTYVARLRACLGREMGSRIVFRHPGYVLELGIEELDCWAFEKRLDEAQRVCNQGEFDQAIVLLERALRYWRGKAFDGFAESDWAQPMAVRLEERRIVARVELARSRVHVGDVDRALAEAQEIVEACPLRERPRGILAQTLYLTGQQVAALRVLEEYRLLLSTEFGLEVSEDLRELGNRIARRDPGLSGGTDDLSGYELLGRLGSSARVVVYRARHRSIGREVVVKVSKGQAATGSSEYSLEREAKLGSMVEHANIVPVYDYGRTDDGTYLVTRFFRGGSLRDCLETSGTLSRSDAHDMLTQLGDLLRAIHSAGLVHLGVDPRNVLLDGHGGYYLKGFGSAQFFGSSECSANPYRPRTRELSGSSISAGIQADARGLARTIGEALTGTQEGRRAPDTIAELVKQFSLELS